MLLYAGLVFAGFILGHIVVSLVQIFTPPAPPPKIEWPRNHYVCYQRCDRLEQPYTELCHKCHGSGTHTPQMFVGDDGKIYRSIYQD